MKDKDITWSEKSKKYIIKPRNYMKIPIKNIGKIMVRHP